MRYLVVPNGVDVQLDGEAVEFEVFEIASNPEYPLSECRRRGGWGIVGAAVQTAASEFEEALRNRAEVAAGDFPGAKCLVFLVQEDLHCLSADAPPLVGWSFWMHVGVAALGRLPDGYVEKDTTKEFPFWEEPLDVKGVVADLFRSQRSREEVAHHMGTRFGLRGGPTIDVKWPPSTP